MSHGLSVSRVYVGALQSLCRHLISQLFLLTLLLAYSLHQLLSIASAAAMLKHLHEMVFTKYPLRTEALGARQLSGQKQAFKVWSSREPQDR